MILNGALRYSSNGGGRLAPQEGQFGCQTQIPHHSLCLTTELCNRSIHRKTSDWMQSHQDVLWVQFGLSVCCGVTPTNLVLIVCPIFCLTACIAWLRIWSRCLYGWMTGHWSNVLFRPLSLICGYITWGDAPKFSCPGLLQVQETTIEWACPFRWPDCLFMDLMTLLIVHRLVSGQSWSWETIRNLLSACQHDY